MSISNDSVYYDKILVIILHQETNECDPNISNLQDIFSDSYYKVEIMSNYREALIFAHKKYPDTPTLIIKDNSIILFDIKKHLEKVLLLNIEINYLCTWGDSCHRYININNMDHIKMSNVSFASQAVLYLPSCRKAIIKRLKKEDIEIVLKKYTKEHQATVFMPNIVHFDINLAKSNSDYLKINGCLPIVSDNNDSVNNQLIWIFLLFILLILLSLFIPYYIKYKKND